jgi:hypothetical protein
MAVWCRCQWFATFEMAEFLKEKKGIQMIREFWAPRVLIIFFVLWAISWAAMFVYIRANQSDRKRFIRHATAPFISGAATFVSVVVFLAAVTFFN